MNRFLGSIVGFVLATVLAACTEDGANVVPASRTLGGTVAIGAPLVGANVNVVCKSGSKITQTTDAKGAWSFVITDQVFPCAVQVTGGNVGTAAGITNTTAYHSVALTEGIVNVTPLTDIVVASLADTATPGAAPSTWFAGLATNATAPLTVITQAAVDTALTNLKTVLPTLTALQGTKAVNPLTAVFSPAAGDAYDGMLTALSSAMQNAGFNQTTLLVASVKGQAIFNVGGSVAVGVPIVGATVGMTCSGGSPLTATTGSNGEWMVTLTNQVFPCAVQAKNGTIGSASNTTNYHAVAIGPGTVNVTPLTDLVVANLVGNAIPSAWYAGLTASTATLAPINSQQVVVDAFTKLRTALSVPASVVLANPVTTVFSPEAGNATDDLLTTLRLTQQITGVTYADLLTQASAPGFTAASANFGSAMPVVYSALPKAAASGNPVAISGTAGVGNPIVGGTIGVSCKSGGTFAALNTSTTGAWYAVVGSNSFPCAVQVTGGNVGTTAGAANATNYHSVALSAGTVNVTPLTDIMVAKIADTTTVSFSTWFANFAASTTAVFNATVAAVDTALTNLKNVLPTLASLATINPITSTFVAVANDVYDGMLTALNSAMQSAGLSHSSVLTESLKGVPIFGLGGTVAAGAPVAGATVAVTCTGGAALSATTGSDGSWLVKLSNQVFPCAVQAKNGTVGSVTNTTNYHAIAIGPGTVNVTPLTNLLVANLVGSADPSAWFAALGTSTTSLSAITQTLVDAAISSLRTALANPTALASVNPFTTTFSPVAGNPMDDLLTSLQLTQQISAVSYANLLSNAAATGFTPASANFNATLATVYASIPAVAANAANGSPVAISGTVAVGKPIVAGGMGVSCKSGGPFSAQNTSDTGAWFAVVGVNSLPCAVQVNGGTVAGANNILPYHAIALAAGTVNVTPLTDLVVANLAGNASPQVWYTGFGPTTVVGDVTTAVANVSAALPAFTVANTSLVNPLTTPFSAVPGDPVDAQLTALQAALAVPVTQVRYDVLLSNVAANQKPDARFLNALVDPTCAVPKAATTTGTTAGALVLNASRTTGVAPFAVSFEAYDVVGTTTSMDPANVKGFHEVKYTWDFGDPACGATWSQGSKANVAKKNIAYGPVAAHVFETPGTYTVTLTGFDGTNSNSKTTTVTVTDPNFVFAANTLCVSNSSLPVAGQNGCPTDAVGFQTTKWTEVIAKTSAIPTPYKRILLKRGERWSTDGIGNIQGNGPGLMRAYGAGKNPIISMDANEVALATYNVADWRFADLEITTNKALNGKVLNSDGSAGPGKYICQSVYNKEPGYLNFTFDEGKLAFNGGGGGNYLLLNLHMHDMHAGFGGDKSSGMYIVDSVVEDMFDGNCRSVGGYIALVDRIGILGSRVSRTPSYHGVRIQGTANSVISNSQFEDAFNIKEAFTIRGKTVDNSTGADGKENYRKFFGNWSENIVVSDNVIQSTGLALLISPQSGGHSERVRNVIVERNYVKGNGALAAHFEVVSDLTIRNNIFVSDYGQSFQLGVGGNLNPWLVDTIPPSMRMYVYNNSLNKIGASSSGYFGIYVTDSSNNGTVDVSGKATDIVIKNNIAYSAPGNSSVGQTLLFFAPYDNPVTNYTASNNSLDAQVSSINPFKASTPSVFADFAPADYAANNSNADSTVPVWDDFNLMPLSAASPRVMGAIHP